MSLSLEDLKGELRETYLRTEEDAIAKTAVESPPSLQTR